MEAGSVGAVRLPAIEWKEISDDHAALRQVWEWAERDETRPEPICIADCRGPRWAHYGLYVDGQLRFCVSVEEHRPGGYEVHADAAPGLSPLVTRAAGAVIMNALLAEPESRVIAWVNGNNRAAQRLARYFMQEELTLELNGFSLIRYGMSHADWQGRINGQG